MLVKEQISRLSSTERMEAMELLWDSFSKEGIDYPSPDWHAEVLAARSQIIDSTKATWLSVDELQGAVEQDTIIKGSNSKVNQRGFVFMII